MLNPNDDRLNYGELLAPPVDYTLDFAIGTTYSLDLDALVGACISLGFAEETDSDLMKNSICLLSALRATSDKIALFCEGGQIHMPNKITPLYILLENMVFSVATKAKKGIKDYPSFHPKLWLLKYVDKDGTPLYRVIVLSRNLTFDRSWDVSFCMDGKRVSKRTKKNKPLEDFISYLINQLPVSDNAKAKGERMQAIISELKNVEFELNSREFNDFDFVPVGIGSKYTSKQEPFSELLEDKFHELMIVSPFISKSIINEFNSRSTSLKYYKLVLITRALELSKLDSSNCSNFDMYVMKDYIVDGESYISEDNSLAKKQDIHAKLYMVRRDSNSYLYLGSLNASHNALFGNVEFMIKLYSKNAKLNLSKLKKSIIGEDEKTSPFQRAELSDTKVEDDKDNNAICDKVIKNICRLNPRAIITENDDLFDVSISFDSYECDCNVTISPLLSNKIADFSENITFTGMALNQLSQFYKISATNDEGTVSRVITIETENMPENRDKAVVSSVFKDDKNSFYNYISFWLGDSVIASAIDSSQNDGYGANSNVANHSVSLPALYEKMLKTAATQPERFKEIDFAIEAISADGVIPDGFEELYKTFRKVVKI